MALLKTSQFVACERKNSDHFAVSKNICFSRFLSCIFAHALGVTVLVCACFVAAFDFLVHSLLFSSYFKSSLQHFLPMSVLFIFLKLK